MSVLIKGMEMPTSCDDCFMAGCSVYDHLDSHDHMVARPHDCPLVEIPPHGRLIDADAMTDIEFHGLQADKKIAYQMGWNDAIEAIAKNAPTIIDAEECE